MLDGLIKQVEKIMEGPKGRDQTALMQLRARFIMLSHADREAGLPPEFRAGAQAAGPGGGGESGKSKKAKSPPRVREQASLPAIEGRAGAGSPAQDEGAKLAALQAKATEEAYDEALKDVKSWRKQAKRLQGRLGKAEQAGHAADAKVRALEAAVLAGKGREERLEQRLHSAELLLKKATAEASRLAESAGASLLAQQTSGFKTQREPETVAEQALQTQVEALKDEGGRRAVLIGQLEGQLASSEAKMHAAESRARLAEQRLEEAARTSEVAREDLMGEEAAGLALKKKAATLSIRVREKQSALDFITKDLEEREASTPTLRICFRRRRQMHVNAEVATKQSRLVLTLGCCVRAAGGGGAARVGRDRRGAQEPRGAEAQSSARIEPAARHPAEHGRGVGSGGDGGDAAGGEGGLGGGEGEAAGGAGSRTRPGLRAVRHVHDDFV